MKRSRQNISASFKVSFVLPFLFLGVAGHASMAMAQSPGTFTATGDMTTARIWHTATLLTDGKVLIAGGNSLSSSGLSEASAELYDPVTGIFEATGSMTTPRERHTATLLPNGKVLIAGGYSIIRIGFPGDFLASAELYDPATGTFAATGGMITSRREHTATLLNDGKVLIAGGDLYPLASAELYDPIKGTFTSTGDMTEPGADSAALLPNGRVLITRGYLPKSDSVVGHTELYDPSTGTFARSADSIGFHAWQPATLLMNGKVSIAGGANGTDSIDCCSVSAEVYDPATGTWAPTGSLTTDRGSSAATLLPDGSVLVAGGLGIFTSGNFIFADQISSAEIYNPTTGAFSAVGAMIRGHYLFTATLLSNGKVLITGGRGERGCGLGCPAISLAELYNPPVLVPAPVLFSVSGDGQVQGAIQHAGTYRIASASDPAVAGEALTIYLTGLADGSVIPPQVAIGGLLAEIMSFGNTPGYPGLNYLNVRVPSGITSGSAVPVRLNYLARSSNEVTIGVH